MCVCDITGDCLEFLGSRFRGTLRQRAAVPDAEVGTMLLSRFILVHVDDMAAKFECLLHMMRKLYCFAQDGCCDDNADALSNQELLLPGHLLCAFLKEKLDEVRAHCHRLPLLAMMLLLLMIKCVELCRSHSRLSSPQQCAMREWRPRKRGATSAVIAQPPT